MRFGVNLLLLSDTVDRTVCEWFGRIAEMGFDGVEVPIFAPDAFDVDLVRSRAEEQGLALTASGALPPGSSVFGEDREAHRAAEGYLRGVVRVCRELGVETICGPLFKPVGQTDPEVASPVQREEAAKRLAPLAEHAGEAGVTFAFEPLNRFETDFLNTTCDAVDFCRKIDRSAAKLLLDTFHMHIEEKDTPAAILQAHEAGLLAHFHASENDRGVAGTGQVHWDAVADAMARSGYDDWVVLESFNQGNQAIRTAVSCWRPFYDRPEAFMAEGLAFVRSQFGGGGEKAR